MAITYRVPGEDEFEAFLRPVWRGFGDPEPSAEERATERMQWEQPRSLGALDDGEWVGGTGAFTMDLTLPGGAAIPAAGVTMVGVAATHRRRGILTELMRRQLDDVVAAGEPVAILTASESLIYGRYGYGVASEGARLQIDPRHGALRPEAEELVTAVGGRMRQISIDEARALLPDAYERIRVGRPGSVRRSHAWWESHLFLDQEGRRDGAGSLGALVHLDDEGRVDGWALTRVAGSWPDRLPTNLLRAVDILAVDDAVHLALWQTLMAHDLVTTAEIQHGSLDDPLRWALRDPRRLRAHEHSDWLFLRLLDIPAALGPRRWGGAGRLVMEVSDRFRPASGGRFAIESDASGAGSVTPTDAPADLEIETESLAALALGTVSPTLLARVGRIRQPGGDASAGRPTAEALRVADTLFATDRLPHCLTMF